MGAILGNVGKMEKPACIFGPKFRQERVKRGFSLWHMVHDLNCYLANLQRIEKGLTEPRVHMAFRMLESIDANPGGFLAALVSENPGVFPEGIGCENGRVVDFQRSAIQPDQRSCFGPLLAQARISSGISQAAMAKMAGYNVRNINAVEHGKQEPGIIKAVALVIATGSDVRIFFNQMYELWKCQQLSVK